MIINCIYIMDFVKWCNNNQGFWSFILAMLSLVISVIAIAYSIINFINDNRKKFRVICNFIIDEPDMIMVSTSITNVGNKPLGINEFLVLYNDCKLSCISSVSRWPDLVMPSETINVIHYINMDKDIWASNNYKTVNKHFKVGVIDNNSKKHFCKHIYYETKKDRF